MSVGEIVRRFRPDLGPFEALYKDVHKHPELSCLEARTASVIAHHLRGLGFEVHENIGGHGVAGVLENGPGKAVMLRAELDALPIREQTGLAYASTRRMVDMWGRQQPVMHACGHDMHMACLVAAAKLLADARSEWSGTLITVFQPNEEHTGGAQAMVDDGLYDKIPSPDLVMAQHGMQIPSGSVSLRDGAVLVSADTVRVRLFSTEGHAANPQIATDPVKVASKIIVQLDDLVKSIPEDEYAAISVQEIHAGQPGLDWVDKIDVVLDVKAYNQDVRRHLLDGVKTLVERESNSSGTTRSPEITSSVRAPVTVNDANVAKHVRTAFGNFFGTQNVIDEVPSHPCEDFSILATSQKVPYIFWFLGRADREAVDRARKRDMMLDMIPIEHSPFNAPLIHPTLETGMNALSIAALTYLASPKMDQS